MFDPRIRHQSWINRRSCEGAGEALPTAGVANEGASAALAKFIPNSVPKSGTNMLQTMLNAIPGLTMRPEMIPSANWQAGHSYETLCPVPGDPWIPVDVDCPHFMRQSELEAIYGVMRPGEYLRASHIMYSDAMRRLMERYGLAMVLMIRDPRDVVVSQVHYTMKAVGNPLHAYYTQTLGSFEDRVVASITGSSHLLIGGDTQHVSIAQRFAAVAPWREQPCTLEVRFEDLVGERGGGSAGRQRRVVESVLRHVGLAAEEAVVNEVSRATFSEDSPTFRAGRTGAWREAFTPKLKTIFKEIAGQTLIDYGYARDFDW